METFALTCKNSKMLTLIHKQFANTSIILQNNYKHALIYE